MVGSRKLPTQYENPIDNVIINLCEKLNPIFYILGATPNNITSLSLIFGMISILSIYNDRFFWGALFYFIQYFFDCMDGNYARKYNMVSKFGDLYDHIKDIIVNVGLLSVLIYKYSKKKKGILILFSILYSIISIGTLMQLGCQQKYVNYSGTQKQVDSKSILDINQSLCFANTSIEITKLLKYTRYLGSGTLMLIVVIFLSTL